MKPSPLQDSKLKEFAFQTRFATELLKAYNGLGKAVEDAKNIVANAQETARALHAQLSRINSLPKGEKGDRGAPGPQGIQGRPGKDGVNGKDAVMPDITLIAKKVEKLLPPVAEVNKQEIIDDIMNLVKDLGVHDLPKIANELASYRNQLARPLVGKVGKLAGKQYGKNTYIRGGGGGSTTSGETVTTQYLLIGVQDGDNVTIDLTQLTNWATFSQLIGLYRNNIPQTEGASYNFTLSGGTVTVFNADASEIFNLTYSFT